MSYLDSGNQTQYFNELHGALQTQGQIMPEWAAQMQRLTPMLQGIQNDNIYGQAQSNLSMYGKLMPQYNAFQQQYASGQMGMLDTLGQQGTQAAMNGMTSQQRSIYDMMGSQALGDLSLGSSLNSQETQQSANAARGAMEARGLQYGNQAVGQEVLNNYNLGQQRKLQRQQFAQQQYQNGIGVQQLGLQGYANPAMQSSMPYGLSGGIAAAGAGQQNLGQSSFLSPESQYYANIRGSNVQMDNANTAANATMAAGMMGGIGSIFGGFLSRGTK